VSARVDRSPACATRDLRRLLPPIEQREHSGVVNGKRWKDLSPHARRLIIGGGAVEGTLKIAALIDLARRPSSQIRGSKLGWAVAITLINSAGAVPIAYFTRGKRR
jgi:hypothetical protein